MKSSNYQRRFYRDWVKADDLYQMRIADKDTDLQILSGRRIEENFVKERIKAYRWDIEHYITRDNRFFTSLEPIPVELNALPIIKIMAEAAKNADVGPMAAVAGAIAQLLGQDLFKAGYREIIIENGGDIFIRSRKSRLVGIYAGRYKALARLKIKVRPTKDKPIAICTSSATIGHSLSFGNADCAIIISRNAALADAVATSAANRVKTKKDLQPVIKYARSIKGILAVAAIMKGEVACWGDIEFVR